MENKDKPINVNINIIKENSQKELFSTKRKILRKTDNLLGKIEFNQIQFNRKYLIHFNDPYVRLYYTNVKPIDAKKSNLVANLCIVHGFGHNSTAFYEMAYEFAKQGINCHLIDFRSHGLSGGTRFDFNIENMHTDIITLIKQAENDVPDLPLFIFGHSLGGGLVSSLFINNQYLQVHGIILSSPLLGYPLNMEVDQGKLFFISKIGHSLKDFLLNGNINPSSLTKDDKELINILTDHKNFPISGMGSFRSIIKLIERIIENARQFTLPCLIFHGKMDRITNIEHSKTFYECIRSKNKELVVYDNGFHEMYCDFEKEEMFNKIISWIKKNKTVGKTDFPFPIDITIGAPKQNVYKFKFGFIIKLIIFLLYIYIAYKTKNILKTKTSRLLWPITLVSYLYKSYFLFSA